MNPHSQMTGYMAPVSPRPVVAVAPPVVQPRASMLFIPTLFTRRRSVGGMIRDQERVQRNFVKDQERVCRNQMKDQERVYRHNVRDQERAQRHFVHDQEKLQRERLRDEERKQREQLREQERIQKEKAKEEDRIQKEKAREEERIQRQKAREEERIQKDKALEVERIQSEQAKELEKLKMEKELAKEKIRMEKKLAHEKELAKEKIKMEKELAKQKIKMEKELALEKMKIKQKASDKLARKACRDSGEAYVNAEGKYREAKKYIDKDCLCKHKCLKKLGTVDDREKVFLKFKALANSSVQNAFLAKNIDALPSIKSEDPAKAQKIKKTFFVQIPDSSVKIRVCKEMFCNVHGISTKRLRRKVLPFVKSENGSESEDASGNSSCSESSDED